VRNLYFLFLFILFRSKLMKAYAQDVRERMLRAVDHGYPKTEMVQRFGISLSTLKR